MPGMDALSGGVPGGRRVSARWSVRLRWTALGLCITGMFLLVAVLILPWPMGEGSLRTWIPAVYAFRTPALVLLAVGLSLAVGILVAKAFSRSGRTDSAPLARWGLAWLCLSALVFPVAIVMGYDRFAFVPVFAVAGFLPALTFRSTGARVVWAIAAAVVAWWSSIALASATMQGGGAFAGVGVIAGLVALAALQFTFAVAGLLRAAFRR